MLVVESVTLTGRLVTVLLTPLLVVQAQFGIGLKVLIIILVCLVAILIASGGIGWVDRDAVVVTFGTIGFLWFVSMILTVADIVRYGAWEPTYYPSWIECASSFTQLVVSKQFDQAFALFTEKQQLESSPAQFRDWHVQECLRLGGFAGVVDFADMVATPLAATSMLQPQLKDIDRADCVAVVPFRLRPTAAVSNPLGCMLIGIQRESGEPRIHSIEYTLLNQPPLRG